MKPAVRQLLMGANGRFSRYVDPSSGNDSNAGTAGSPWRTGANLTSSDTSIGFKRGATNAAPVSVTGSGARIGSYGGSSATKAVFDTREALTGWAPHATLVNVYQATASLTANVKNLGNIFKNGVFMTQVSSLVNLDAGGFDQAFVSDWTLAAPTVYIKSATNPASDGNVYTIPDGVALTVSGTAPLVEDIETSSAIHQDGSFRGIVRGGTMRRSRHTNGNRHCCYAFPGWVFEECTFGPAKNDLEGSSNTLVVNDTVAAGEGYTSYRCTYLGTGGTSVTGPLMHDGVSTTLMGNVSHVNDRFVDLISWITANGNYTVRNPVFANVTGGASITVAGFVLTVTGASGTIDQLYNNTAAGTVNSTSNSYTVMTLGTGFYRTNSAAADVTLNISGDTLTINGGVALGNNARVIHHARGPVTVNNMTITTTASGLCAPIDAVIVAGFSTASTFTGNNNTYPFGSQFQLNGTTYNTLTEWKAATSQDAASTVVQHTAVGSDSFTRADENLENTTWVRVGGAAAQAAVRSNQLAAIGTTQTLYRFANAASTDHWIEFTVAAVPVTAGPTMVVRASDANNWVGIRWTATTWQIGTCLAGVLTASVLSSTAVVPAAGQVVTLGVKGDLVWLYVDGRCLMRGGTLGASSIGANTGVGLICRNSISNPFVDDFKYGTV